MKRGNSTKKFGSLIHPNSSHHSQGKIQSEKKIEVMH